MKMLRGEEYTRWVEKNIRENTGYCLKPGDALKDCFFEKSVIKQIRRNAGTPSEENHGTIEVEKNDGSIDHYAFFGWEKNFRVTRA